MIRSNRDILYTAMMQQIGSYAPDSEYFVSALLSDFCVIGDGITADAQECYDLLRENDLGVGASPQLGDIIFYGKGLDSITHMMVALNDSMCIGGQNSAIRPKCISYRHDNVAIVRPPWPLGGLR